MSTIDQLACILFLILPFTLCLFFFGTSKTSLPRTTTSFGSTPVKTFMRAQDAAWTAACPRSPRGANGRCSTGWHTQGPLSCAPDSILALQMKGRHTREDGKGYKPWKEQQTLKNCRRHFLHQHQPNRPRQAVWRNSLARCILSRLGATPNTWGLMESLVNPTTVLPRTCCCDNRTGSSHMPWHTLPSPKTTASGSVKESCAPQPASIGLGLPFSSGKIGHGPRRSVRCTSRTSGAIRPQGTKAVRRTSLERIHQDDGQRCPKVRTCSQSTCALAGIQPYGVVEANGVLLGLIEIKSPEQGKTTPAEDLIASKKLTYVGKNGENCCLQKTHPHCSLCHGLFLLDLDTAPLMVYCNKESEIIPVGREKEHKPRLGLWSLF